MKFFDYFRTAFKNLGRQRSRTFLTIFAIMIGAISITIMLSLVLGAKTVFMRQFESMGALTMITINNNPDAEYNDNLFNTNTSNDSNALKLTDKNVTEIKAMDHVTEATPVIQMWVESMQLEGSDKKSNQSILGYDVSTHVFNISLIAGRELKSDDMDKVIIGPRFLRRYGYGNNPEGIIGKKVILNMKGNPYNDWTADPPKPKSGEDMKWEGDKSNPIPATIVGVTNDQNNDATNYVNIAWVRKLQTMKTWEVDKAKEQQYQKQQEIQNQQNQQQKKQESAPQAPDNGWDPSQFLILKRTDMIAQQGYSSIMLKVDDAENVQSVAKILSGKKYGVITAQEMIDNMSKMFLGLGLILGAIGGIALLVAAIGIINTMVMAIYERTREIGVMRACGATRSTIRRLFTFEAALLGFWGGIIGLLVSYGLAKIGNYVANHYADTLSVPIKDVISFPLWLIAGVIAFTTLIGLLAGLYPAIKAARMNPVEALRYE